MKEIMSPLIQASELLGLMKSDDLVIIDASNSKNAKSNYEENHLMGALFVDTNTQLADIKADLSNGGRHPLPKTSDFIRTLSDLGISAESHVVIYDDYGGANAAARMWWMLKSIGHRHAQVLDGGLKEAQRIHFPMSSQRESVKQAVPYEMKNWQLPQAQIEEVEKASLNKNCIIIDVREKARYNGETEPIDLVAGHIPNAINIPFTENMDDNGLFLSQSKLREKYDKVFDQVKSENTIIHCGSGVTACHSLLAITYAGLKIPKLYVGSWSEWSRNNKIIISEVNK